MKDRLWGGKASTLLGAVAGMAWVSLTQALPPECAKALSAWESWLPGVLFAVWGAWIKGPASVDGNGNVKL